jgi:hypothetical protein
MGSQATGRAEQEYRFEFFRGVSYPFEKDLDIGFPQSDDIIPGTYEFSIGDQVSVLFGIDRAKY